MSTVYIKSGLVLFAVVTIIYASLAAGKVPTMPDLYNTLYANSRPKRPEGTLFFLFVFPLFQAVGTFALVTKGPAFLEADSEYLKFLLPVSIILVFGSASLNRSFDAIAFFN